MSLVVRAAICRPKHRRPSTLALFALTTSLALAACTSATPLTPTQKPQATSVPKGAQQQPTAKPSPGASPAASPSPSPSPAPLFSIVDPTLADATPWVSLRLSDGEPRIVSGWRLEVGAESITIPGNAIVQPGDQIILHVGEGRSSEREIFLGANSQALALAAAPGATVRLVSDRGELMAQTTVPRY